MSDDERRIEAFEGIVGSGMLTDPERIQKVEAERERRQRAWRPPPEKGFGEVLDETPPKEHERVGVYVAAPLRKGESDGEQSDPDGVETGEEDQKADGAESPDDAPPPRVPPDPRMVALHQQFDRAKTSK